MKTLTKEQIENLTPDQQLELAAVEAKHVLFRQQLIGKAGPSRSRDIAAGLLAGAACGLAIFSFVQPKALAFAIILLVALVNFQVTGLSRRLEALLQLINPDPNNLADQAPLQAQPDRRASAAP